MLVVPVIWLMVIEKLLRIYDVLAPGQQGKLWRAKVRQTLQRHFCPRSRGVWTLPS